MKFSVNLGTLTLVFIVLKLLGKISWPWLYVLAPTLVPIVVGLVIMSIGTIMILRETPEQRAERQLKEIMRKLSQ